MTPFAPFVKRRTALLTTYKRDGTAVATPVTIAVEGDHAYVRTWESAWKAKRMRNNPAVLVAPATVRGRATGPAIGARSRLLEGAEAKHAARAIARRQPILQGVLVPLAHRLMRYRTLHYELRYPGAMTSDGCDTGVCGSDVPPLIGSVLTGTGLTVAQAIAALERGEQPAARRTCSGGSSRTRRSSAADQANSWLRSSMTASNASTTAASNWLPAPPRSSTSAASVPMAGRQGRCESIASKASQTATMRAPSGMSSPARPSGCPLPSKCSRLERTSAATASRPRARRRMRSAMTGWSRT